MDGSILIKKYFDEKGYKRYILIHADINSMPIKDNSVDYIYGGGVIEHFPDTEHILKESYRILKKGGVSFNTVPAFNLWWMLRVFYTIPAHSKLRKFFEYIHINLLKNKILEKNSGYELCFSQNQLVKLHEKLGFKNNQTGEFAFHPSSTRLKNKLLRKIYYIIQKNRITTAIYFIYGVKE